MDLWDKGIHECLVGDVEADGEDSKGSSSRGIGGRGRSIKILPQKVSVGEIQAGHPYKTTRKGRGCFLLDDLYPKTGQPIM